MILAELSFKLGCSDRFCFGAFSLFLALQVAFGSLYRDEVLINPSQVIGLVAAASMLQLVSGNNATFN